MSEPETVELDESAADTIAEKAAGLVSADIEAKFAAQGAELAEIKAMLATPKRTELGDADGLKAAAKPGESGAFYGGDDHYTLAGDSDADIAVNLFLASKVLGASNKTLSRRGREVMVKSAEAAVKAQPKPIADRFVKGQYLQNRADVIKAMTSTTTDAGDEWVPTFATSELWKDVHLETAVSASITRIDMPTNPYDLPTLDSDVTFYYASTENTAVTGSQPNTGKATLTAKKIQADVTFSGEVTEDSIIAIAPTVRANLVRRGAQVIDDLIVHGDSETGGTGNVNSDNGAPTAGSFYLALDGMRKFAIVTNTGQLTNIAAAPSTTNFLTTRGLLTKYGTRASDLRLVIGPATHNAMLDIASIKTLDVFGPNATIVRGEVGRIFGVSVLLSEATPRTDSDLVASDGKSDTTAGSLGWWLLYNVNGWKQGFRREFQIESDRNIQTDSNILVASFRMALIPSGISVKHTAVGRNITV